MLVSFFVSGVESLLSSHERTQHPNKEPFPNTPTQKLCLEQDGDTVGVINDFEIYANRKEEIVARVFGVIDPGHPYIEHIYSGGDWLIGGEIQLLDRIR